MGVILKSPISSTERFCMGLDSLIEKLQLRRESIHSSCHSLYEGWSGGAKESFSVKAETKLSQFDRYLASITRMRDFFANTIIPELKELQELANSLGIPFGVGTVAASGTVFLTQNFSDMHSACNALVNIAYEAQKASMQFVQNQLGNLCYTTFPVDGEIHSAISEIEENQDNLDSFRTQFLVYANKIDAFNQKIMAFMGSFDVPEAYQHMSYGEVKWSTLIQLMTIDQLLELDVNSMSKAEFTMVVDRVFYLANSDSEIKNKLFSEWGQGLWGLGNWLQMPDNPPESIIHDLLKKDDIKLADAWLFQVMARMKNDWLDENVVSWWRGVNAQIETALLGDAGDHLLNSLLRASGNSALGLFGTLDSISRELFGEDLFTQSIAYLSEISGKDLTMVSEMYEDFRWDFKNVTVGMFHSLASVVEAPASLVGYGVDLLVHANKVGTVAFIGEMVNGVKASIGDVADIVTNGTREQKLQLAGQVIMDAAMILVPAAKGAQGVKATAVVDDAVRVSIHNIDDLMRVGVKSVDDLARLGITSADDLARIGIHSTDDLAKLGITNADDLARLGVNGAGVPKVDASKVTDSATIPKKGGETVAGHGLQKHAGRNPDIWGKVSGNSEAINNSAMNHIDDIMKGPGNFKVVESNGRSFIEKILPDGRGIRLNMDGTFKGFIDQVR